MNKGRAPDGDLTTLLVLSAWLGLALIILIASAGQ